MYFSENMRGWHMVCEDGVQCINTAYEWICFKMFFIIYDVLQTIMLDNDLKSREQILLYVWGFSYVHIHTYILNFR